MDAVGRKVESQVQFWSLLGPSLVLLSIAVLLFKASVHWYFPVSALIGIPLCVKWKMKGMVASLVCLFVLSAISYQDLELDDRYWHVGLSLTMAFSFIILTLSLEEAQGLIAKLRLESQSRLDNFSLLDEKLKAVEQERSAEKEKSKLEIQTLTHEVTIVQEDKQTFYKLAQLAKDELIQIKEQHDLLMQDLLYKKQQIAQLHERLDETEMTVQEFVNSDSEKQIEKLIDSVAILESEKDFLKTKIVEVEALKSDLELSYEQSRLQYQEKQKALEHQIKSLCEQLQTAQSEKESKNLELQMLLQQIESVQKNYKAVAQQIQEHESLKLKMQETLELTQNELRELAGRKESNTLKTESLPQGNGNSRRIESMYMQLKNQFQEKCAVLDATRRELFHANEEILKKQREQEEEKLYGQTANEISLQRNLLQLSKQYEKMQRLYQLEIDDLFELVKHLFKEIPFKKK